MVAAVLKQNIPPVSDDVKSNRNIGTARSPSAAVGIF